MSEQESKPSGNVYQRVQEVKRRVGYVQKDKEIGSGSWGYKAVTHDMVTAMTRTHLIDCGVLITPPSIVKSASILTGTTTSKGIPHIRYEATYSFDVVNVDEPSDRFTREVEVHAIDEGDKAPGKAMSYADKYLVMKLLDLETGEDDEGRVDQKPAKAAKPASGARAVLEDAYNALDVDMRIWIDDLAGEVTKLMRSEGPQQAYEHIEENQVKDDTKLALWYKLDSDVRNPIKKYAESLKGTP